MAIFYLDGDFKDETDAVISIQDLSVLRGYGVFDYLRTYNKKPFRIDSHIKRFKRSAELTLLNFPWSDDEIKSIVNETLSRNDFPDSNVRLMITGGESLDSLTPGDDSKLVVLVTDLKPQPAEWYVDGVKIITSKTERYLPEAKSTNYLNAIIVLRDAKKRDAIESIYVDRNNRVLEGTTSNLFFVKGHKIVTAGDGILSGVTREVILESYKGFEIEVRDVLYDELCDMDEAFLTSSNKEVVPVIQIDEIVISDGPGKITLDVMDFFRKVAESY
jgi:branched-chain amino acid aminotransferase